MLSFRELQKEKKTVINSHEFRMVVLGNCATQFFSDSIEGMAKYKGINLNIFDADYNQITEQLLNPESETYKFNPDVILLWLSTEKLYEDFLDLNIEKRTEFSDLIIDKIEMYWGLIDKYSNARVVQLNFTELNDNIAGQYSLKITNTFIYQLRRLNYLLQEKAVLNNKVFLADILSVQLFMGKAAYYDSKLYYSAKMPVSLKSLPYIADRVTDVIMAMQGKIKKCLVMDLDNTIWGGVIGDDGINGIEIGELGRGHVFSNIQRWIKQLNEYGIILAVCSKNNEEIAKEPFEKSEDMILKLSDISIFVANWDDKASNIKLIQESLNIGMDSMVFIDDNPFERNLVKQRFPEIEVPDLPDDQSKWLSYLYDKNYFEVAAYSQDSGNRAKQYQAEFERKKTERSFDSIDDYLQSLEMVGSARKFETSRYSRIAQLTQRSNQFNLRTVRYTEDEIEKIANDKDYITLYFTLSDKFGDHGLVSVVIMKKKSDKEAFIDTWLMSCRVLKRGMEEYVVNNIVNTAVKNGIEVINAEYIPTNKNAMVKDIYQKMGFDILSEGKYTLIVDHFQNLNTYIKE